MFPHKGNKPPRFSLFTQRRKGFPPKALSSLEPLSVKENGCERNRWRIRLGAVVPNGYHKTTKWWHKKSFNNPALKNVTPRGVKVASCNIFL